MLQYPAVIESVPQLLFLTLSGASRLLRKPQGRGSERLVGGGLALVLALARWLLRAGRAVNVCARV